MYVDRHNRHRANAEHQFVQPLARPDPASLSQRRAAPLGMHRIMYYDPGINAEYVVVDVNPGLGKVERVAAQLAFSRNAAGYVRVYDDTGMPVGVAQRFKHAA